MHTHLSESRDPVPHVWENGGLVTHLEVKVDGLMREGGELITCHSVTRSAHQKVF